MSSYIFPESYEGHLEPKVGPSKYKVIDDPEIIAKKNAVRQAFKDEFTKQIYNPYRQACGIGGMPFDSGIQRYTSMMKTQYYYFRPGPRTSFWGFMTLIFPLLFLRFYVDGKIQKQENRLRTGQIAYKDRVGKNFTG